MRLRTAIVVAVSVACIGGGTVYTLSKAERTLAVNPAERLAVRAHAPSFVTAGETSAAGRQGRRFSTGDRGEFAASETVESALLTKPAQPGTAPATRADTVVDNEIIAANLPAGFEHLLGRLGLRLKASHALSTLGFTLYRLGPIEGVYLDVAHRALSRAFPGALVDVNHAYALATKASEFPPSHARTLIGWRNVAETCGSGIRIGMIDTSVDTDHPALEGLDIIRRSFVSSAPGRAADHGTAIAAMLIGRPIEGKGWGGLLPSATLFAANIFAETEDGAVRGSASAFVEAVDWLAGADVHVANMSLAGPANRVVGLSIDRARRRGLAMVAAAGNEGADAEPAYPAGYPAVIAVTAIDTQRNIYPFANHGRYIDFAAPGVRVWTAIPGGGRYQSGTSFASPFVSVLVGIDVANGALTPRAGSIRKKLRRDAIDLGQPGHDTTFGWGLIGATPHCPG